MSDIQEDVNGDVLLTNGDLTLNSGIESVRQFLSQRLRLFLAEWYLDQDLGVPYFEEVLVKNPNPIVIDQIFKKEILSTRGVLSLEQFDLQLNTASRLLTVSFRARTLDGIIDFSEGIELV
jgi:hypothetical protein